MHPARHPLALLATAIAALAASCGNVEGKLLDELRSDEHAELCVQPQMVGVDDFELEDGRRFVSKAGEFSFMPSQSSVDALDRLQKEGYVSREATSLPQGFGSSFDAYAITDKGSKYFRQNAFGVGIEVLIGKKRVEEVLEYTEPGKQGPQMTQARFRYDVSFNDFVDDLDIERELEPEVARAWPGEGMAVFSKTNKGWRLEHAMWQ
jgi:DNA-binding PadR family transcriptional regulator